MMRAAAAVLAMALQLPGLPALAQAWQPAETQNSTKPKFAADPAAGGGLLPWQPVPPTDTSTGSPPADLDPPRLLSWEAVPPGEEIPTTAVSPAPTPLNNPAVALALPPSGPTYANFRALWRDGDWLPQISNIVPVGFGPQGLMLSLVIQGTDCHLGKGECQPFTTYQVWQDSIKTQANGEFYQAIGFGDPIKAISVIVTNSLEKVSADIRAGQFSADSFQGAQTGLHLAKAFGPDTSVRVGVENLITWDPNDTTFADMVRNFYTVASQRIRLQPQNSTSKWFRNAYVTGGIGNGEFKPIEQIFIDQTAALRAAGCATYGYTPKKPCSEATFKRALRDGSDYGQLNAIGALGIEVYDGIHLIAEWTGRNLNAGLSWRPFPQLGLIITPMINSIVRNCEYPGCTVSLPDYPDRAPLPSSVLTQRTRLSLTASLEFKF